MSEPVAIAGAARILAALALHFGFHVSETTLIEIMVSLEPFISFIVRSKVTPTKVASNG